MFKAGTHQNILLVSVRAILFQVTGRHAPQYFKFKAFRTSIISLQANLNEPKNVLGKIISIQTNLFNVHLFAKKNTKKSIFLSPIQDRFFVLKGFMRDYFS